MITIPTKRCKGCNSEFYPQTPRVIYCWRCSDKSSHRKNKITDFFKLFTK